MKNKLDQPSVKSAVHGNFVQKLFQSPLPSFDFELGRATTMAAGLAIVVTIVLAMSSTVWAKKVEYRKSQDVNFDAVDVDGTVRNPDGAYLAQKRGIDFMPLYKVRKNFDDSIKESVEYVK